MARVYEKARYERAYMRATNFLQQEDRSLTGYALCLSISSLRTLISDNSLVSLLKNT